MYPAGTPEERFIESHLAEITRVEHNSGNKVKVNTAHVIIIRHPGNVIHAYSCPETPFREIYFTFFNGLFTGLMDKIFGEEIHVFKTQVIVDNGSGALGGICRICKH